MVNGEWMECFDARFLPSLDGTTSGVSPVGVQRADVTHRLYVSLPNERRLFLPRLFVDCVDIFGPIVFTRQGLALRSNKRRKVARGLKNMQHVGENLRCRYFPVSTKDMFIRR